MVMERLILSLSKDAVRGVQERHRSQPLERWRSRRCDVIVRSRHRPVTYRPAPLCTSSRMRMLPGMQNARAMSRQRTDGCEHTWSV